MTIEVTYSTGLTERHSGWTWEMIGRLRAMGEWPRVTVVSEHDDTLEGGTAPESPQ
jgi:hypothetical protein